MNLPAQVQRPPTKRRRLDGGEAPLTNIFLPIVDVPVISNNPQTYSLYTTQYPNREPPGFEAPIALCNVNFNGQPAIHIQQNGQIHSIASSLSGVEGYHNIHPPASYNQAQSFPGLQSFISPQVNAPVVHPPVLHHPHLTIEDPLSSSISVQETHQQYIVPSSETALSFQNSFMQPTSTQNLQRLLSNDALAAQCLNYFNFSASNLQDNCYALPVSGQQETKQSEIVCFGMVNMHPKL
jgi:hypothetical protein